MKTPLSLSFSSAMALRLTAAAIIIILFAANVTIANAHKQGLLQLLQLLTNQPATVENGTAEGAVTTSSRPAAIQNATTFQSTDDSFRVQVPDGWVIHDVDNTEPILSEEETTQGFEVLARLCPDEEELQQQQQGATATTLSTTNATTTNATTTNATTTNATTTNATTAADWLTSELNVDGQTYPTQYMIDGGSINNMTISNETKSLIVSINSTDVGTLDIRLPRNVIDAKTDEGSDAEFASIIDDAEFIEPGEPTTTADMRTLSIGFPSGAEKIEILGTSATTLSTTNASGGSSSTATSTNSTTTTSNCQGAQEEVIHIIRYPDLEAAIQEDNNVTTYHLGKLQEVGYRDMQIVHSEDIEVNLANPQTDETITTVPAKFVEMTYSTNLSPDETRRGYFILTGTAATSPNQETEGYAIFYEGNSTTNSTAAAEITTATAASGSLSLPSEVAHIFDSFELIVAPEVAQALEAQGAETTEGEGGEGATATFQSTNDGFRVQVPQGWVIQDINNTRFALAAEVLQGYGILAQLCPEEQQQEAPLANAGGNTSNISSSISSNSNSNSCQRGQEIIYFVRYPNLGARLGFASDAGVATTNNINITHDTILAYQMQKLQEVGYRDIRIVNSVDTTINIKSILFNNNVMATAPAKLVEMTYSTDSAPNETRTGHFLSTAIDATARNLGMITGYSIFYEGNSAIAEGTTGSSTSEPPAPVQQVFDSFELIAGPEVEQTIVAALRALVAQAEEPKHAKEKEPADVLTVEIISDNIEGVAPAAFEFDTL